MLILGCATCATGVLSYFFLIDNPKSSALKLNAEQEILVEERTRDNAVVRTTTIKKEQIYEALKEVRFWCFCISCFLMNLQNGAMSAYVSQIALNFGFTVMIIFYTNLFLSRTSQLTFHMYYYRAFRLASSH